MEHREALVFSMHLVSTLLSRLLFLTLCIFNVNIYSIYQAVFFLCYHTCKVGQSQVSYWGRSLFKCHVFPREFGSFPIFKTRLDSLQIRAVNTSLSAVLPQETVVHKRGHTDTALATYRNETIEALCPPYWVPGSPQGIIVYLPPRRREEKAAQVSLCTFLYWMEPLECEKCI